MNPEFVDNFSMAITVIGKIQKIKIKEILIKELGLEDLFKNKNSINSTINNK